MSFEDRLKLSPKGWAYLKAMDPSIRIPPKYDGSGSTVDIQLWLQERPEAATDPRYRGRIRRIVRMCALNSRCNGPASTGWVSYRIYRCLFGKYGRARFRRMKPCNGSP